MGKVILYIATSLDGYISDEYGSVNFLYETPPNEKTSENYNTFYENIDSIIMGNNTYKQIVTELSPTEWVYPNKLCYVYSTSEVGANEDITYTNEDPKKLLSTIKDKTNKNIWLVGGSALIKEFQNQNLIDEYIITVMPIILGKGISLFQKGVNKSNLHLSDVNRYEDIIEMRYKK